MNETEFHQFIDTCYAELEKKQELLQNEYLLDQYESYFYDQKTGNLQFLIEDRILKEFKVVFIGTFEPEKSLWFWAWSDNRVLPEARKQAEEFKKLFDLTGYQVFSKGQFDSDLETAYELSAMAVHILNAKGLYRAEGETSDVFMAIIGEQ